MTLMHHFNEDSLRACFHELDGKKAVGVDGISKDEYGKNLDNNLTSLVERLKQMSYRPGPVRQVLIPKEGKPGAMRPLGIGNLEDKIVQSMMRNILESIYEPLFRDCSYGFRPGRGCHDAIRDLHKHLFHGDVSVVIDVDLADFFGSIKHSVLETILREKIADERLLRYLSRMFKSGVLSEGELSTSDEGVPQGSPCSPVLANVMAHYVIDVWLEDVVKKYCLGRIRLFRYCDDFVICCELESDAIRIRNVLSKRLEKYGLNLNEEKTRVVPFSRKKYDQGEQQGCFDFLGFTFVMGKSRKGFALPKLKTNRKRKRVKLRRVAEWARKVRNHMRLPDIWRSFCQKLRGHIAYYSVSFNTVEVERFLWAATRILFKWLNRRSQRKSMNWEQFNLFIKANPLPPVRVVHSLL